MPNQFNDFNDILRFSFLIHDVSRLRCIVVDRVLKPLGITRSQWWVLAFLSRRDGMAQTALASDLDLTKAAIGNLLDRLEATGFVERRDDVSDGRTRRVFLTRQGGRLISTIRKAVEPVERGLLTGITDADFDRTVETLRSLKRRLLVMIGEGADEQPDIPRPAVQVLTADE
jgi:DNA-binding MarR family transcriptional regulator